MSIKAKELRLKLENLKIKKSSAIIREEQKNIVQLVRNAAEEMQALMLTE